MVINSILKSAHLYKTKVKEFNYGYEYEINPKTLEIHQFWRASQTGSLTGHVNHNSDTKCKVHDLVHDVRNGFTNGIYDFTSDFPYYITLLFTLCVVYQWIQCYISLCICCDLKTKGLLHKSKLYF